MNRLIIVLCVILLSISSCKNELNDFSGSYQNIKDKQILKVKRINDKEYEITSPYDTSKLIFTRKGDILYSSFEKQKLTCEFNSTLDTLFGKANGKTAVIYVRTAK